MIKIKRKYNNIILLYLVIILLIVTSIPTTVFAAGSLVEKSYLVEFNNAKSLNNFKIKYKNEINSLSNNNYSGNVIVEVKLNEKEKDYLESSSGVKSVEEEMYLEGCGNVGDISEASIEQWHLNSINLKKHKADKNVKVALIDSGISYSDALRNVQRYDLIGGSENILFDDPAGHGSSLAGIIAADGTMGINGINPNVELLSIKVLDSNLRGKLSDVVEAIYIAIENEVDILNISMGMENDSDILHQAIIDANKSGILVVCSSGNTGHSGVLFPAAYEEVLAVGSVDTGEQLSSHTTTGPELDILAPGEKIVTTGHFDGITAVGGTSAAAAGVTGVASILLSKTGSTSELVKALLVESAKNIDGNNVGIVDCGFALDNYDEFFDNYTSQDDSSGKLNNSSVKNSYSGADNIIEGLWAPSKHEWLVNKGSEGVWAPENVRVDIMAEAAAQTDYFANGKSYTGIHGFGNYFFNARALWKYANYLGQGKSKDEAKALVDNLIASDSLSSDNGTIHYDRVFNAINKMFESPTGNLPKYVNANNDTYNKYLVAGALMHMVGDVYAHRTLVPEYVVENAQDVRIASGSSTDFGSKLGKNDFTNWDEFKAKYYEDKEHFRFTKIEDYMINPDNDTYEDNVDFCRERFNAALKSCRYLAAHIGESGATFSPDLFKEQLNVTLENFEMHIATV